jgi:hypothetical protein
MMSITRFRPSSMMVVTNSVFDVRGWSYLQFNSCFQTSVCGRFGDGQAIVDHVAVLVGSLIETSDGINAEMQ